MPPGSSIIAFQSFDLTDLAVRADRARRFRIGLVDALRVIGFALAAIGVYFFVAPPVGSIPPYSTGPASFIGIGAVLVILATWVRAGLGPSARRLVLSRTHLSFEEIPGRKSVRVEWKDPRFKLEIDDYRQIRNADPNSKLQGCDLVISSGRWPETAVPLEAVEAILRIAEQLGLRVSRRTMAIGAKAPLHLVTIRSTS
jgi:hypothetical protein